MLVMYADDGFTLVLAITNDEVEDMKIGNMLTYFGPQARLAKNICIMYGRDKQHVLEQIKAAGVKVSKSWEDLFMSGKRTDVS
jgi:hypothetical protein